MLHQIALQIIRDTVADPNKGPEDVIHMMYAVCNMLFDQPTAEDREFYDTMVKVLIAIHKGPLPLRPLQAVMDQRLTDIAEDMDDYSEEEAIAAYVLMNHMKSYGI